MKMLVQEVEVAGLESLIGQRVTIISCRYIYTGKLIGVNETCVLLDDAGIVYETGPLTDGKWKNMQPLPGPWFVQCSAIESFGIMK